MSMARYTKEAVLRVGEVCAVEGRRIFVLVDAQKNVSDLLLDGEILKNISVNSFVEIRKGFLSIIGKIDGERIEEVPASGRDGASSFRRTVTITLSGYIDETGRFVGGTRELPLIGNEAYVLTAAMLQIVHSLVSTGEAAVHVATHYDDGFDVALPVDGLFNSHIAIFGNTGSGKSNTLARLYTELVSTLSARNAAAFRHNARFLLFDFNGEFSTTDCITREKTVYAMSTRHDNGQRLPLGLGGLLDVETVAILCDATEKTQKPFLRRALRRLARVRSAADPTEYVRGMLRRQITDMFQMTDRTRTSQLQEHFRGLLRGEDGDDADLFADVEWHGQQSSFRMRATEVFFRTQPARIQETLLYRAAGEFTAPVGVLAPVFAALQLQLIDDVLANHAQHEHIAPAFTRLKAREPDIARLFDLQGAADFWQSNFVVLNLNDVSIEMKKTIPLLIAKAEYARHKQEGAGRTLTILIDEAHNILSTESFREAESWKDYRLETFEEIIKEGRKFGVFVTISSQRPSDISPTIASQAHNYFIHRLINQLDLKAIASAVSYIDKLAEESIPTLPTGSCIFSGVASGMPIRLSIKPLPLNERPQSATRAFRDIVPESAQ
jgi:DNA helicase HerA-like ATPase